MSSRGRLRDPRGGVARLRCRDATTRGRRPPDGRGVPHPRSRLTEKEPEGQADPFPLQARLTGNAVDVVALTGPAHHEKGAVSKRELLPPPILFPPRLDDESPGRAERGDRHQRVRPQLRLVARTRARLSEANPSSVALRPRSLSALALLRRVDRLGFRVSVFFRISGFGLRISPMSPFH